MPHTPSASIKAESPDSSSSGSDTHSSSRSDTQASSSSDTQPSSSESKAVVKARQPVTRRGHFKSRLGCFNCKRRRVKCDEQRPLCKSCCRLGLECQYPPRGPQQAPVTPAPNSTGFTLEDLRFHFQFLTVAYPSLPLRGGDIWSQCASLTHSYDYLAHAALGLGASHLSQNGSTKYTTQALQHRVKAINLINQQLETPMNKSRADADALYAALICIVTQSGLMADGMIDYLVMTRGANLVATSVIPDYTKSIFSSFSSEGHLESLSRMICDQPKDLELINGFRASAMALEPLCLTDYEKRYHASLLRTIDLVPESSFHAWKEYVALWIMPSILKNEDFVAFVDPDNYLGQLLIIHMFLLDYILGRSFIAPEDEPKCPGRKSVIIAWTQNVLDKLPPKFRPYGSWLQAYCSVLAHQDARYLMSP